MPNKKDLVPGYTTVATVEHVDSDEAGDSWEEYSTTGLIITDKSIDPHNEGYIWVIDNNEGFVKDQITVIRLIKIKKRRHELGVTSVDSLWEVIKEENEL